MRFTKMHGLGNDYVYVDGTSQEVPDPAAAARKLADRHFGVGGDGLILILPPTSTDKADVRMRMFNADGSEGEMCGNGIRCVAKYAHDHGLSPANPLRIETAAGLRTVDLNLGGDGRVATVAVDMGRPVLELGDIPVKQAFIPSRYAALQKADAPHEYVLQIKKGGLSMPRATFVSTGNPHCVIFTDDVAAVPLETAGPLVEHYAAFPNRANAHWAQANSRADVTMRTWERGSGITLACGTGACAVVVAGVLTGRLSRDCAVHLPGGDLRIEWRESDDRMVMTGPATEVFSGEIAV